ncbi:MAG: ATP synthase F1 subunit delta [Actinobacteria bacterium]|nr:ATP synthase F1 subunit delta [Actinomycetota bacterium]
MAVAHRIYAEALLQAAKEKGSLEAVREQFAAFAQALESSPELAELLRNPQIEPGAKGDVLESVLGDADESFRHFVSLVAEKNRAGELAEIHAEWERLLAAEAQVLRVELTTAVELSDGEAAEIVGKIEKAAGRRVEATREVDPDLIGGLVLQAGSMRVDGSVRGRLEGLRHELLARR